LVGARGFYGIALQTVGAGGSEIGQAANRNVFDNTVVIQDFLQFGASSAYLTPLEMNDEVGHGCGNLIVAH
jgi:hypothetical protein